jgi:branched-chain amino acid transport system ATP-binding protein
VLKVTDLRAGYGRVPALHGVSLHAEPGEILVVLGPNGAGKTTLLRTIAGFIRPEEGAVELDGRPIAGQRPNAIARRGLRMVLEGHRVFPELSVADNLKLGQLALRDRSTYRARVESVYEIFPILREKARDEARSLSGGQQQLLALGQSFVGDPRVLLCDEPSLGVAQRLIPQILDFLRRLAEQGVAVVLVEQLAEKVLPAADRVLVVRQGVVVAEGPPGDFQGDGRLRELFTA